MARTEPTELSSRISYLKRRLAIHRRRLKYWSGNPSLSNYGPTGKKLRSSHMEMQYELAKCDAHSIASRLDELGVSVRVVDPKRTFQCRYHNPRADEVLIWPEKEEK